MHLPASRDAKIFRGCASLNHCDELCSSCVASLFASLPHVAWLVSHLNSRFDLLSIFRLESKGGIGQRLCIILQIVTALLEQWIYHTGSARSSMVSSVLYVWI